jgi:nicotinamidase-related amidase
MPEPLLIIDIQQGFLSAFTRHIPGRVVELVKQGDYHPLLFTRFINTPGSPYDRLLDWHDCSGPPQTDLAQEVQPLARRGTVFTKHGFTGLPDDLAAHLRRLDVKRLVLVGIDTDMCVLKCAMDLFDLGIEPVILTDCCASTAGLQAHFAGLAILSRNIGPHQLRETGLGEGSMAAPRDQSEDSPPPAPGWRGFGRAPGETRHQAGRTSRRVRPRSP